MNCSNNGICNINGTCDCFPLFIGYDCSKKACKDNCNNRGFCLNGACQCLTKGTSGDFCEFKQCLNDCNGTNGICDKSKGECQCNPMFFGSDCSLKKCKNECHNHGVCNVKTGLCKCDRFFGGEDCRDFLAGNQKCSKNCSFNGICNEQGVCECFVGFEGKECQKKTLGVMCSQKCLELCILSCKNKDIGCLMNCEKICHKDDDPIMKKVSNSLNENELFNYEK